MQCLNQYKRIIQKRFDIPPKCGKCYACRKNKSIEWIFRIHWEDKKHIFSQFLTLTYSPEHVPTKIRNNQLVYELHYPDVQLFLKNLRRKIDYAGFKTKIRYFIVGEYGKKFKRPHYHIILWGNPLPENTIQKTWDKGFIHIGQVEPASINYVSGYTQKKQPTYISKTGVPPEFTKMSKGRKRGEGIGTNYLDTNALYHTDLETDTVQFGNYKMKLPRYFKDLLWNTYGQKLRKLMSDQSIIKDGDISNIAYELDELTEKAFIEDNIKNRINKNNRIEAEKSYKEKIEKLAKKPYNELTNEIIQQYEIELIERNKQRLDTFEKREKLKINILD
jgi:hypothetical protein